MYPSLHVLARTVGITLEIAEGKSSEAGTMLYRLTIVRD